MKKWPRLYKKSKTGAIIVTDIVVNGSKIVVTTGQIDGAKIDHETICQPKNEGRANETTAEEQAIKEAEAKWKKKLKDGYVEDSSGEIIRKLPMKVKKYQDQIKNVKFPCWVGPKLDGVNGEFRLEENELKLYSRGGDEYPMLDHIRNEILDLMKKLNTKTMNGEIYNHDLHLQDIVSAVKKHNENTPKLMFYVFDLPDNANTFDQKIKLFNQIDNSKYQYVKIIRNVLATNHDEIDKLHEKHTSKGFEGIIIRNLDCVYRYNIRSSQVFKYKKALDAEFKIIGYNLDKNGHPVFICITPESKEFKVKLKGTDAERKQVALEADTWINKWLKIEFESYSKDLKPLKPVGLGLRECDVNGEPIE